jgi:hypothetical protein
VSTERTKWIVAQTLGAAQAYLIAAGFLLLDGEWLGDVGSTDSRQALIHEAENLSGTTTLYVVEIRGRGHDRAHRQTIGFFQPSPRARIF